MAIADVYWQEMVAKKKVDASDLAFEKSKRMVDVDTLIHKDAKEIVAEWMCYQTLNQLNFSKKLECLG